MHMLAFHAETQTQTMDVDDDDTADSQDTINTQGNNKLR